VARIKLKLLDILNKKYIGTNKSLVPKYIVKIRASELNNYFKYERLGKKHPYKIQADSLIVLDEKVQRGVTDLGRLRQDDNKVKDIKNSLLGSNHLAPKAFMGNLVWNIREQGEDIFEISTSKIENKPSKYEVEINTKHIYLPDSAHRHLGICEAYKESLNAEVEYEQFDEDFEFAIDVYNLSKKDENLLFNELNAKQKKITAAKVKELDFTSPIGDLKDSILSYDQANQRLFYQNIEVNSNTNDRHTLMTMSVFTASIKAMFGLNLIKECKNDEDLKNELTQYYCEFFYKLQSEIVVSCKIRNKDEEIHPFTSLYKEHIYPVENGDYASEEELEEALKLAREKACNLNKIIRAQDKLNSNPFVRTLAKLGGLIRNMGDWEEVIENLQSKIVSQKNGRFFQAGNAELLRVRDATGDSIARIKDDNININIQVQTTTLNTIEDFFLEELSLQQKSKIVLCIDEEVKKEWLDGELNYTHILSRTGGNYIDISVQFYVGEKVELKAQDLAMRVEPSITWKGSKLNGKKSVKATKLELFDGYQDESYGKGIKKLEALFEITLPAYDNDNDDMFEILFNCSVPTLNGHLETVPFTLKVQPELLLKED